MNALTALLSHGIAERIGWTLLHSLWQATLIAALLAVALRLLARSSAQLRYAAACIAMIAMALLPAATGGLLSLPGGNVVGPVTLTSQPQPVPTPAGAELPSVGAPAVPMRASSEPVREESWRDIAAGRLESALPYAVCVWLAGVLLFSLRHLLAWTRLRQLRHRQVRPADASLCDRLSALAKRLGIARAVRLVESGLVQVPTVIGWLRPMILLPASAAAGLPADHLEALLLHELAHIRRCDYFVNLAQTILETLGFYHPAVWWVSHRIRIERENCCDDVAARALGDNLRYARALASMEDLRADQPELAMAVSGGSLLARIRRLVGRAPNEGSSSTWAPVLVVGLLLLIAAIPAGLAIAEQYAGPTNELERAVLKGFAENRDKFVCGAVAWTRITESSRLDHLPVPEGGVTYGGQYRMWWDGNTVATKYTADRFHGSDEAPIEENQTSWRGEDGTYYWIEPFEASDLYTSGPLGQEPPGRLHANWLSGAIHWRGRDSLDRRILDEGRRRGVMVEWATTDVQGSTMTRRTVRNKDSGDYRIELYDPARGYGLVRRESFTLQGRRQSSETVRLQEVAPGAWFPVEIIEEAFRIEDGSATGRSRAALDLGQCSFNDRSALPKGIFAEQPRLEQSELQQILREIRQKLTLSQTTDATARTQEPRTVVERFLLAATQGNEEEAAKWLNPRRHWNDSVEWLSGYDMRGVATIADDRAALVVTSAIRVVGNAGPLMLSLTRSWKDTWLIYDTDLETPKGAGRRIEQFLREHPAAVMTLIPEVGKERVVHFPADRSLGTLYTREWDFPTDSYRTSMYWQRLGEARGDVTVPAGKALKLDVDKNAWQAGSPFAALRPDDIQMLDFDKYHNADDSVLADVGRLRGLRALSLTATAVTGEGLGHLRNIPSLKWLFLGSTQLDDEGAAHLAALGSLDYLNLRYTKITDAAMVPISNINGLKWLALDGTAVTDKGMAPLRNLTSLQGLSLWDCGITDEGLEPLAGLTEMNVLDLVATRITDRGLAHLARMQSLRELRLGRTNVAGEGLLHLRGLTSLEYLELPDSDIEDEHLACLSDLDRLKKLYVLSDASTERGLRWLAQMQSPLEELQTGGQGITDAAAAAIARLPSLKSLWIQRAPLTDEGLAHLAKSRSLTKLNLRQVNITGAGLAALKELPWLQELVLDSLYIGEGEFTALGDLNALRHLTVGQDFSQSIMAFSDRDMAALANLKSLRSLAIVSNHVTDAGLQHLSSLRWLEDLRLSGKGITDAGLMHLEGLAFLRTLSLAGTRVTPEAAERLQKAIPGLECRL